ncbi:MAG TPA: DUF72 domain-containing protein, partial [Verrucomicrobiae bacterium]|nr:DUF72 domain-containing protein [Verrucomicrobiae bacterium]
PDFQYSVKANRLITHLKRFKNTKKIIREFCECADVLGKHMGGFLFQLPPGFDYSTARLHSIVSQLDARRCNVVEFRHRSWWHEEVLAAFKEAGLIFCSVSAPGLPDDVIKTGDTIYIRFHGAKHWYRHDYSDAELKVWAHKIRESRAREVWAYFNNDFQGNAFRNAQTLRRMFDRSVRH